MTTVYRTRVLSTVLWRN